jgi:hypothetical protein
MPQAIAAADIIRLQNVMVGTQSSRRAAVW